MAIHNYFIKGVVIKRFKSYGGGFKERFVSTGTTDAQIQRPQDIKDNELYGARGATHLCWIDIAVDAREGDRLVTRDGVIYECVGKIVEGEDIAMNEHIKLILKEYTS